MALETKLFITIDTEEDGWGDYHRKDGSVENINQIPRLQALFDRFGAVPTYLLNWPVLMDDRACRIMKDIHESGRCEIGTHCHPWNTPPIEENISSVNSMMCNLPEALTKAKIANLAAATEERLQVKPQSFRTGRWGFGRYVAKALLDSGYAVDSSVCPGVDWRSDYGPDFLSAPDKPYRFDPARVLEPDVNGQLLEIPASTGFFQAAGTPLLQLRRLLARSYIKRLHLIGLLDRLKVMNFRWLSPELSSAADMITLSRSLIKRGCPTLNLSFHSTSLLPGMSPFVRSQNDLDAFLLRIEKVLEFANRNNIKFSSLSDYVREPLVN
ncbi:MAG: hypothetical protein C4519_04440 [Desulfobacteraceae bacterium]|nr:MAG: hypothetical protein C4519_04440 [Desulfobacteraceae bacterium]